MRGNENTMRISARMRRAERRLERIAVRIIAEKT